VRERQKEHGVVLAEEVVDAYDRLDHEALRY
jgi:hypothetical protein